MQITTTETDGSAFFKCDMHAFETEMQLISRIQQRIHAKKGVVYNKDLILALIQLIETETDVIKLDVYRNALEIVVQRTPDDL